MHILVEKGNHKRNCIIFAIFSGTGETYFTSPPNVDKMDLLSDLLLFTGVIARRFLRGNPEAAMQELCCWSRSGQYLGFTLWKSQEPYEKEEKKS